ncbi:MAG: toprim domain-containing protein [Aquificaceae bacterium]
MKIAGGLYLCAKAVAFRIDNITMLTEWIKKLKEASQDRAVLVEGKRDKRALTKLGVKNVFTLEGKRFSDLPDLLEGYREVILLFDLDKHGERINQKVKTLLASEGYILIEEFREELRKIGIFYVEDLDGEKLCVERPADTGQDHKV